MCLYKEALFRKKKQTIYPKKSNCIRCTASTWPSHSPMLRVTVMMFRDMVESVMLLNDEDCRDENWEGKKINKYEKKNRKSQAGTQFEYKKCGADLQSVVSPCPYWRPWVSVGDGGVASLDERSSARWSC